MKLKKTIKEHILNDTINETRAELEDIKSFLIEHLISEGVSPADIAAKFKNKK